MAAEAAYASVGEAVWATLRDAAWATLRDAAWATMRNAVSIMPNPKSLAQLSLISSLLDISKERVPPQASQTCPRPQLSCPSSIPPSIDTCCLNHPSGHFLQTQFWDTAPVVGPNNSWTIHGLWPDRCGGGFDQYCDHSRSHTNIKAVLASQNNTTDLLDYMSAYWPAIDDNDEKLWAHEWNKHGTCISTLEPACYGEAHSQNPHADVVDYFTHTVSLFQTLDTFSTLEAHGIVPSTTHTYSLSSLQSTISSSPHGYPVTFRCNQNHELNEIWYHFSVRGSLRDANHHHPSPISVTDIFIPTDPDISKSNCPLHDIKYLPKGNSPIPQPSNPSQTRTTTSMSTPTSTSTPFSGRGHLNIHVLPSSTSQSESPSQLSPPSHQPQGCLIRSGSWYTSGTCATYHTKSDIVRDSGSHSTPDSSDPNSDPNRKHPPLFSLSSSFAPCAIDPASAIFRCSRDLAVQSIFSAGREHDDGSVLEYRNSTTFYAEKVPGQFEKVPVYADDGEGGRTVRLQIHWTAA